MRTLIVTAALLIAFSAHAEPKRSAKETIKPIDAKEAQVAAPEFQPKAIEIAAPEFELKTKDLSDMALDKKLATRKSKVKSGEASVLREPVQLKIDAAVAAPVAPHGGGEAPTAPAAATTANKP